MNTDRRISRRVSQTNDRRAVNAIGVDRQGRTIGYAAKLVDRVNVEISAADVEPAAWARMQEGYLDIDHSFINSEDDLSAPGEVYYYIPFNTRDERIFGSAGRAVAFKTREERDAAADKALSKAALRIERKLGLR